MFRRQRSYPPATRERARELRRAGLTYSEIIAELGGDIPLTTLQDWVADIQLTAEQQAQIKRRQYPHLPETRERARELRRAGLTYSEICEALGVDIPKSTLNHWVSDVLLTPEQQQRIVEKDREAAARGRQGGLWGGGGGWNREMKRRRLEAARQQAAPIAERLARDREALMLMASALYMGEGAKSEDHFCISNSDPRIIQAWLALLRKTFDIDEGKLRCQLAITEGMDEEALKAYWSEVTGIPTSQFIKGSVRKDSGGRKREGYKGVCIIHYYSLEVKRFLEAIGQGVIDELLDN